jgi:hypothetical protein
MKSRASWLAIGFGIGLVVGLNLAGYWPQIPVHASATHGQENFAIATGLVEDEMEAVYMLDFVTGDLKACVLSINTRTFLTFYQHNVSKDFGGIKNPKYLMVTGVADVRRQLNVPIGTSVIYVAEMTSGKLACYGLPWTPGRQGVAAIMKGLDFLPMDIITFRTTAIRAAAE